MDLKFSYIEWMEKEIEEGRLFRFEGDGFEIKTLIKEIRNNFINKIFDIQNKFMTEYKNEIETIHEAEILNKFILYIEKEI